MQLENKKFVLKNIKKITVEFIESFILNKGYKPLRWAVVKAKSGDITIEAACIRIQEN